MFLGTYEHRIDPRGRVAIPARFREELKGGVILSAGYEKCIHVHAPETWQQEAEKLAASPITRESERRLNRFIFGSAFSQELDRLGRVLLPSHLRQHAEIKDAVVIVGVNTYVEIWSKENWDAEKGRMDEEAPGIAERWERRP